MHDVFDALATSTVDKNARRIQLPHRPFCCPSPAVRAVCANTAGSAPSIHWPQWGVRQPRESGGGDVSHPGAARGKDESLRVVAESAPSRARGRFRQRRAGCSCSSKATVSAPEVRTSGSASRRQRWCSTSIRSAAHARPHCAYARDATRPAKWRFCGSSPSDHLGRHRLRTPAFMRERGAEYRKRIPIRTDRLR
jgi:hypothetical protein